MLLMAAGSPFTALEFTGYRKTLSEGSIPVPPRGTVGLIQ
jgi:hypothetical protein